MHQTVTLDEPLDQVLIQTPIGSLVVSFDAGSVGPTFYITGPNGSQIDKRDVDSHSLALRVPRQKENA